MKKKADSRIASLAAVFISTFPDALAAPANNNLCDSFLLPTINQIVALFFPIINGQEKNNNADSGNLKRRRVLKGKRWTTHRGNVIGNRRYPAENSAILDSHVRFDRLRLIETKGGN